MKYLGKHWWNVIFICTLVLGFVFGISGFMADFIKTEETEHQWGNALYETFRLFDREYYFKDIPPNLIVSQWLLFFAFLWLSLKVIITIIAPDLFSNIRVRLFYKNHIVICGLNKTTLNLIHEYRGKQMIILAEEYNKYSESLKQKGVMLFFCGNSFDEYFLRKAKTGVARQLYIVTGNDKENVATAQAAFSLLAKAKRSDALKCYTLIKDRELKILLEESSLFKYRTETFDGILLHINEMGIKYGLSMTIDKILPENRKVSPGFLIVGLTEKAEAIILNLAHGLTLNREVSQFTIVEKDPEKIALFQKKHPYLQDFVKIAFTNDCEAYLNKPLTSVFICLENQIEAIKAAVSIRYIIADRLPNIFIFSEEPENLIEVLNTERLRISTLNDKNIFLINTFGETIQYIVQSDPEIEILAEATHNRWRKKDEQGNYMEKDEYKTISGHFKQTNRNQVLDNYIRTFIATGKKFSIKGDRSVVFSDEDMETLAMIEHRRWMIEKYSNGWRHGNTRNDEFKIHNSLIPWEKLSENEKQKDYMTIGLMINWLNNKL